MWHHLTQNDATVLISYPTSMYRYLTSYINIWRLMSGIGLVLRLGLDRYMMSIWIWLPLLHCKLLSQTYWDSRSGSSPQDSGSTGAACSLLPSLCSWTRTSATSPGARWLRCPAWGRVGWVAPPGRQESPCQRSPWCLWPRARCLQWACPESVGFMQCNVTLSRNIDPDFCSCCCCF